MAVNVLVIGGGAGGLCAAAAAAEAGGRVTVLEKRHTPGKKLLATGNGRCNLANLGAPRYEGDASFALRTLRAFPPEKLLRTLNSWGLQLTREEERVYPAVRQASAVLALLTERLRALGGTLLPDFEVKELRRENGRFTAVCADGRTVQADRCVLATGGLAGGSLGSAREDYRLAEGFGHRVTKLFGALAPLETDTASLKGLSGLRLPAYVRLFAQKRCVQAESGEVLITDYGISGICVMQLARRTKELLDQGKEPYITLDLLPLLKGEGVPYGPLPADFPDSREETSSLLEKRRRLLPGQDILTGLLPEGLCRKLRNVPLTELPRALCAWRLPVRAVRPLAFAQVTAGGVDTGDVDAETLSSRLCPGLYLSGEMLDVDGACGGFNLQFAMISGILAGQSAAGDLPLGKGT